MNNAESSPIFDTSRSALRFALNYNRETYSQSSINHWASMLELRDEKLTLRPTSCTLSGLDRAAQAGFILFQLSLLSSIQIFCVTASVGASNTPCACRRPCCSGYVPNKDWTNSIVGLDVWLAGLPSDNPTKQGTLSKMNKTLRRKLIEKYFGIQYTVADIAEKVGVTEATVFSHKKIITVALTDLERSAWSALDETLTSTGIVGSLDL